MSQLVTRDHYICRHWECLKKIVWNFQIGIDLPYFGEYFAKKYIFNVIQNC